MPCVRVAAIFLLLAAVCIQGTTGYTAEDCWDFTFIPCVKFPKGHDVGGYCIVLGDTLETFDGATEKCGAVGGNPFPLIHPMIHMEAMCYLNSMSPTVQTRVWVGANKTEIDDFEWQRKYVFPGDAFEMGESHWEPGQPDSTMGEEKCIEMNWKGMGLFNDDRCERKKNYVCGLNVE